MKRARMLELFLCEPLKRQRPLWQSVSSAVAWQIDVGRLPAGARLPSTRTLARHLRLSRNTIAAAFDALVADGYLMSRVGDGTYVLPVSSRSGPPMWRRRRRWARDPDGLPLWITASDA